jgi:hypothetical protein
MPGASTPPPFFPVQHPEYQSGYVPPPVSQGIPTDQRYQGQIEQRQALLRSIEESIIIEKRLHIQEAHLERQIALSGAQERQAREEGTTDRAMLALERRQQLESYLSSLQQQLAQVRRQRIDALQRERQISAEIDAAFSQQAVLVSQSTPMQAWPQPGGTMPPPRRPVSQE